MGLKTKLSTPQGIDVEYHRIVALALDERPAEPEVPPVVVAIVVASYKNEQARRAGKEPMPSQRQCTVSGADYKKGDNIYEWAYGKLKETEEFAQAKDV